MPVLIPRKTDESLEDWLAREKQHNAELEAEALRLREEHARETAEINEQLDRSRAAKEAKAARDRAERDRLDAEAEALADKQEREEQIARRAARIRKGREVN